MNGSAVLCSNSQTWQLKEIVQSNSLLLLSVQEEALCYDMLGGTMLEIVPAMKHNGDFSKVLPPFDGFSWTGSNVNFCPHVDIYDLIQIGFDSAYT